MDLMPPEFKSANRPGAGPLPARLRGSRGLNFAVPEGASLRGWLVLAALILALTLSAYGGLWFYQRSLAGQAMELSEKNEEMLAVLDKQAVKKLVDAQAAAGIIGDLLQRHKSASRLIDALSAVTLSKVQWTSMAAALDKNSLTLSGKAASYNVLAKQLTAFKEDGSWKNVEVSNIALGKDGYVGFGIDLEFDAKIAQ